MTSAMSFLELMLIWVVEAQRHFNVDQESYPEKYVGFQSPIRFALRVGLNIEATFRNNSQQVHARVRLLMSRVVCVFVRNVCAAQGNLL